MKPSPQGGRPRLDGKLALNGILFVLRTGIAWEDLPQELDFGSGMTCLRPAVRMAVRAVGRDRRRLAPSPNELQQWRESFTLELRHLEVEAEATPRQAREAVRKAASLALRKAEQRDLKTHRQEIDAQAASREALSSQALALPYGTVSSRTVNRPFVRPTWSKPTPC